VDGLSVDFTKNNLLDLVHQPSKVNEKAKPPLQQFPPVNTDQKVVREVPHVLILSDT